MRCRRRGRNNPPTATPLRPRQRLLDLRPEHLLQILRRDLADQLEGDAAVAADDEGLRYAVDAPFDRRAPVGIDADRGERIAMPAEEAAGVVGLVRLVDAD